MSRTPTHASPLNLLSQKQIKAPLPASPRIVLCRIRQLSTQRQTLARQVQPTRLPNPILHQRTAGPQDPRHRQVNQLHARHLQRAKATQSSQELALDHKHARPKIRQQVPRNYRRCLRRHQFSPDPTPYAKVQASRPLQFAAKIFAPWSRRLHQPSYGLDGSRAMQTCHRSHVPQSATTLGQGDH